MILFHCLGCKVIHFHTHIHQSEVSRRTSLSALSPVRDWLVTTGLALLCCREQHLYVFIHIFMYFIHTNSVLCGCVGCMYEHKTVPLLLYSLPALFVFSLSTPVSPTLHLSSLLLTLASLSSLCCVTPKPLPLSQAFCSLVIGCCVGWWLWFLSVMSPQRVPAYCFRTIEAYFGLTASQDL